MNCPACSTSNPADNKFCGKCGSALGVNGEALQRQIETAIKQRLTDRVLVEQELTESLSKKFEFYLSVAKWIFAPSFSVLAIAIGIAVFLGFRTYSDASTQIRTAASAATLDIQTRAKSAEASIESTKTETVKTISSYQNSPELKQSLSSLKNKIDDYDIKATSLMKIANDDQGKLSTLSALRNSNPAVTLVSCFRS